MCGFFVATVSQQDVEVYEREAVKLFHRGPDSQEHISVGGGYMSFFRLAIMDPTAKGSQPFCGREDVTLVCNGEIYNEPELKIAFENNYHFVSASDCEVLLPLYRKYGMAKMVSMLDAEFAMALYDSQKEAWFAGRDPIGIRPLFYGYEQGKIMFASEAKALHDLCDKVEIFPPGHYYDGEQDAFICYADLTQVDQFQDHDLATISRNIQEKLCQGVIKRMRSDVPMGYLLSGGLDSSLVCAIAAKHSDQPITTFSVGIDKDPIDLAFAKDVADFLGCDHHEVTFTQEEVFETLHKLVYQLETWDITTVRASIGMYLVCKYIREKTDIKVVLTGEISDELFGYKYTDFAPSPEAFQEEAAKRIREIHYYDVLRADRCISSHSLEARVPFGDLDFVSYVMSIMPKSKMNSTGVGKHLLRKAFEEGDYLPEHILYREKAAFSDAVGHSMVDNLKAMAEQLYSDEDLARASQKYPDQTPFTKEALWYRDIFQEHFPKGHHLIDSYWMPNREWENCDVADPSARVLPNYAGSGSTKEETVLVG